jgi:hypothetical protein
MSGIGGDKRTQKSWTGFTGLKTGLTGFYFAKALIL